MPQKRNSPAGREPASLRLAGPLAAAGRSALREPYARALSRIPRDELHTRLFEGCLNSKQTVSCLQGGSGESAQAVRAPVWCALRNGKCETFPESFTEGSKNVRHLPRYLSIQRDPEFFSAYHH